MINESIPRTDQADLPLPQESADAPATADGGLDSIYTSSIVIIPTYNERENLPLLAKDVLALHPGLRILVIDDGSPDGTGQIADRLAEETGRVDVIHRPGKLGMGSAYVTGFKYALDQGYQYIMHMDCDFSHRPEDLPRLVAALRNADVVIGSRNIPGGETVSWSPARDVLSKGGSLYARTMLRLPIRDCTGGFKCFRRRALEAVDLDRFKANGFGFQIEENFACHRAGMRLVEVPIIFPNRTRGDSKMSVRIAAEAAWMVLLMGVGIRRPPVKQQASA